MNFRVLKNKILISDSIRSRRKQQMDELYEIIHEYCEEDKKELYKNLKQSYNEQKTLNLLYSFLEELLSLNLREIKKIYKTFDDDKVINLDDLLYHKDGKTLEERVHYWFEKFSEDQLMELFFHLCLILDTEGMQLISNVIKEKTKVEYVEISSGSCGGCEGGIEEISNIEDVALPPYHPGCGCHAYFYEEYDLDPDDPTI